MANQSIKLLTGIPRSGTTLCCHLLNKYPNTVALHEPISPENFDNTSDPVSIIETEVHGYRVSLLSEGKAVSKQLDGEVPSNPVAVGRNADRTELVSLGEIHPGKTITGDFILVVKHNALFSALLPKLRQRFDIFCVVRNPLPVLASWQTVDLPVSRGTVPMAEKFDPGLHHDLAQVKTRGEKHLQILTWFFDRFRQQDGIVRYEEVIATGGSNLSIVAGQGCHDLNDLEPQIHNSGLAPDQLQQLADLLLTRPDIYADFYSEDDIRLQLEDMIG